MRPARRVICLPSKRFDALDLRPDRVREVANACYQEPASVSAPVPQLHIPAAAGIVIERGLDLAGKLDVPSQVELVCYVLQVSQNFGLPGEMLGPVPFVKQLLGKGVGVGVALRIEPRPRVSTPVPCASHPRSPLEDPHPHTQLPQPVQLVQAGNAGANHNCIEIKVCLCKNHTAVSTWFIYPKRVCLNRACPRHA